MSNYESEWGEIKLPTAEFARIRKAFELEARGRQERAFEETQKFWKGLTRKQQTDPDEYAKAESAFVSSVHNRKASPGLYGGAHGGWSGPGGSFRVDAESAQLADDLSEMLRRGQLDEVETTDYSGRPTKSWRRSTAPRRVQKSKVDWATNRTTDFRCGEASVTFDKDNSSLRWESGDNNHQVERAHDEWLYKRLNDELHKVRWSRGTGGVFYYRSEYDDGYEGEHSNECDGFGPIGFDQAPDRARDYVDTKGVRHSASEHRRKHYEARAKAAEAYRREMARLNGPQGRGKTTPQSTGGSFAPKGQAVSSAQFPGHPLRP